MGFAGRLPRCEGWTEEELLEEVERSRKELLDWFKSRPDLEGKEFILQTFVWNDEAGVANVESIIIWDSRYIAAQKAGAAAQSGSGDWFDTVAKALKTIQVVTSVAAGLLAATPAGPALAGISTGLSVVNAGIAYVKGDTAGAIEALASGAAGYLGGRLLAAAGGKAIGAVRNARNGENAAAKGGARAAGKEPNRIYSARELVRRSEAGDSFHNFPESFNDSIFKGNRQVISDNYVLYTQRGSINGRKGVFEIGVRPSASGRTEVITHRFFNPDK